MRSSSVGLTQAGSRDVGVVMHCSPRALRVSSVAIVLLVGHFVLRIPFDDLLGGASGVTGNPAIVVYAARPTARTSPML
jgi:uncharacterized transporter YbjL